MSAFHSPTEAKPRTLYNANSVSGFGDSQLTSKFFVPYQPSGFNPLMYLSSYTSPSTSNCYLPSNNPQQLASAFRTTQTNSTKNETPSRTTRHASTGPFVCGVCGKEFRVRCRLVAHVRRHTGERPFSCPDCGRAFSDAGNLQRHRYTHVTEPRFHCNTCLKAFRQASCLSNHRRFHCAGADGRSCLFCRRTFKSSSSLQMHLRFKHRDDAAAVNSINTNKSSTAGNQHQDESPTSMPIGSPCSDNQYGRSCYSPVASRRANSDSGAQPLDRCGKSVVNYEAEEEANDISGLDQVTVEQLKLAVASSAGTGISTADTKGRPCNFLCPACPRRFAFQCRLVAHLRSHTNLRPFICPDCGRAFTQRGYLLRHAAVHANERPFVCSLCDRAYKHYGSLVNHRRAHSKNASSSSSRTKAQASTRGLYRCAPPTMAPSIAPSLPAWASAATQSLVAGTSISFPSNIYPSTQQLQNPRDTVFFRSPFGYVPQ